MGARPSVFLHAVAAAWASPLAPGPPGSASCRAGLFYGCLSTYLADSLTHDVPLSGDLSF